MTGNKITFLFKENEKIDVSNNTVTFIFGESAPVNPPSQPCYNQKINTELNTFTYNCGCKLITYDNNTFNQNCYKTPCDVGYYDPNTTSFNIDCECDYITDGNSFLIDCSSGGGTGGNEVDFGIISSYQGYKVETVFSLDIYNVVSEYGHSSDAVMNVADMRFPQDYPYGFESKSSLYTFKVFNNPLYYGHSVNTLISFDDRNAFETDINSYFGHQVNGVIVYNPYNPFLTEINSYYGHQVNTLLLYNPYHEFSRIINFEIGHQANTLMTFKEWENLVDSTQTIDIQYGHSANTYIHFDTYNELIPNGSDTTFHIGWDSTNVIRYSDDPYIKDVDFYYGHVWNSDLEYDIGKFTFGFVGYHGFNSDSKLDFVLGLAANGYYGWNTNLIYFKKGYQHATFNATSRIGFVLQNVFNNTKSIDLMRKTCCVIHKDDLRSVEMLEEPSYDKMFDEVDYFGILVDITLSTEPRFKTTFEYGMYSDIIDRTVYLDGFEFYHGISANTRNMSYDTSYELTVGNFMVDQNEIVVELTKPFDDIVADFYFSFGFESKSSIGVSPALPYLTQVGHYANLPELWFDSPMRPVFWYGFRSYSYMGVQYVLPNRHYYGWSSRTIFYEPPHESFFGWTSIVDELYTDYEVELMDKGELDNEYLFQTKNGDIDHSKPNGESIEGYEYTHYVKGRCY